MPAGLLVYNEKEQLINDFTDQFMVNVGQFSVSIPGGVSVHYSNIPFGTSLPEGSSIYVVPLNATCSVQVTSVSSSSASVTFRGQIADGTKGYVSGSMESYTFKPIVSSTTEVKFQVFAKVP